MLKNECFIIKEMSFLKINDPLKRDTIVKEYLDLKNRIRSNLLSEKVGEMQLQTDLSKFYRPITETQKATTREITEGLKPISERLENIRREVQDIPSTISAEIAIKKYEKELKEEEKRKKELEKKDEEDEEDEEEEEEEEEDKYKHLGKTAFNYLHNKGSYKSDLPFGIHEGNDGFYYLGARRDPSKENNYFLNSKYKLTIANNNILVDDEKFIGTPGLWELIMADVPEPKLIEPSDLDSYKRLLLKTNVLHRDFDPKNPYPRASTSYKWTNILSPIWDEITAGKGLPKPPKTKGSGVVVIPSDPNALLERLDLLLASQEAGHTGVRNELVSICDELKRQGVLDTNAYKRLNHIIKK